MDVTKVGTDRVQQDRVSENSATQKSQSTKETSESKKSAGTKSASNKGGVKWSADAQLLSEGVDAAKNSGDVRADRVAQLKHAIQNGHYKVDSKAVADKMISESLKDDLSTRND